LVLSLIAFKSETSVSEPEIKSTALKAKALLRAVTSPEQTGEGVFKPFCKSPLGSVRVEIESKAVPTEFKSVN